MCHLARHRTKRGVLAARRVCGGRNRVMTGKMSVLLGRVSRVAGQGHRVCRGVAAAVGNADEHFANALLFDDFPRPAAECYDRAALAVVADFDVPPADAAAPTGAQRLEYGFLGCPAAGKVLRRLSAALAVANLVWRVDARDEQLAMPFDHLRDSQTLYNV